MDGIPHVADITLHKGDALRILDATRLIILRDEVSVSTSQSRDGLETSDFDCFGLVSVSSSKVSFTS